MAERINALVVDLSHHDPADDYVEVRRAGIWGVIYKSTEGADYDDPTYWDQRRAAKQAGLLWGSYHFASASPVQAQIDNYLRFTQPSPDELICLDWEDNPTGNGMMSARDVEIWIREVEHRLNRPGQVVIYSGNTAKEQISGRNAFLGARRLWLAQYGTNPDWQESWSNYWLWQFTDGEYGPQPHTIDGIGACDINSFDGTVDRLRAEWATGAATPSPGPEPETPVVTVSIDMPDGVDLQLLVNNERIFLE